MRLVCETCVNGSFHGWDGNTIYELANGQVWKQARYHYHYHYAYRPKVRLLQDCGRYFMEVAGVSKAEEVRRIA